jgi:hypothetical protein
VSIDRTWGCSRLIGDSLGAGDCWRNVWAECVGGVGDCCWRNRALNATTRVSLLPKIIGYLLTDCGSTLEMRLVLDRRHDDDVLNGHCEPLRGGDDDKIGFLQTGLSTLQPQYGEYQSHEMTNLKHIAKLQQTPHSFPRR